MRIGGEVQHPGAAEGPLLVLGQPLSFWGGFDPATGRIVDRHHPQCGASIAGTVLVLPGSRGSAGTPAGVAEAIRGGVGPAAILLRRRDVNITIGAMVARRLYGAVVPVLVLPEGADLATGVTARVATDGGVTIT